MAKQALARIFRLWPASGNETEKALLAADYWHTLGFYSEAAIVDACEQGCRGKLGNPAFRPTAAELCVAAEKWTYAVQPQALRRLAPPVERVISNEERLRVKAKFAEMQREIRAAVQAALMENQP